MLYGLHLAPRPMAALAQLFSTPPAKVYSFTSHSLGPSEQAWKEPLTRWLRNPREVSCVTSQRVEGSHRLAIVKRRLREFLCGVNDTTARLSKKHQLSVLFSWSCLSCPPPAVCFGPCSPRPPLTAVTVHIPEVCVCFLPPWPLSLCPQTLISVTPPHPHPGSIGSPAPGLHNHLGHSSLLVCRTFQLCVLFLHSAARRCPAACSM